MADDLLKTLTVLWELMMARGVNLRFGREVYPLLKSSGLSDVAAEGHVSVWQGGSVGALLCLSNFDQMHDALISSGRLTEREFADDIARLDDPDVIWPSSVLWTTCGRKP